MTSVSGQYSSRVCFATHGHHPHCPVRSRIAPPEGEFHVKHVSSRSPSTSCHGSTTTLCRTVHRGERHPPPVGPVALTLDMSPIPPRGTSFAARSHDSGTAQWAFSTIRTTASTTRSTPGEHSYPPHSVDFVETFLAATGRAGPRGRSFPVEPIARLSITPSRFEFSVTFLALGAGRREDRRASVASR